MQCTTYKYLYTGIFLTHCQGENTNLGCCRDNLKRNTETDKSVSRVTTHVSSFFASSAGAGPLDWPRGSKVEPENTNHTNDQCYSNTILFA